MAYLVLFLIIFGIWKAYDLVEKMLPESFIFFFYLTIYMTCFGIIIIFIKLGKSGFKMHGFKKPANTVGCILISILFVLFYVFIILTPGFMVGFTYSRLPYTLPYLTFTILEAILISLTNESIFRGYIFKTLTVKYGFFTSLYISSLMFSVHKVSIMNLLTMNVDQIITYLFTNILHFLVMGLFLGFFFYKINWSLLGPIIFGAGVLLYTLSPPITANQPWWMRSTFEMFSYICLIIILEAVIKEPKYRRRRYGLES